MECWCVQSTHNKTQHKTHNTQHATTNNQQQQQPNKNKQTNNRTTVQKKKKTNNQPNNHPCPPPLGVCACLCVRGRVVCVDVQVFLNLVLNTKTHFESTSKEVGRMSSTNQEIMFCVPCSVSCEIVRVNFASGAGVGEGFRNRLLQLLLLLRPAGVTPVSRSFSSFSQFDSFHVFNFSFFHFFF